ncbi:MAG: alpha-N-arabinofuranosidase [Acidobacteria bacterium]|nr:alpha-N-arabinofuranosidase [Acidobacteriota bacterium]
MRTKSTLSRRAFVSSAAAAPFSALAAAREENVVVHPQVEIGKIRPELHGHFAEHLGSCVYGGLWVGKNSPVPNLNGHRKQAVDYLKALGIPVLRWPGGCFADDYHWRDGIGPLARRPKRVNIHWGNYTEDNSFGTHEFVELCRLIGAEPYFAGNVGSGTPRELRDWVEYCNYPAGSTLSDERAANGSPEPFRIRYWGVGNENWGCGGRMTPEEYATHYRRFAGYMRNFGTPPYLVACGPNSNDIRWTRGFMDSMQGRGYPHGFALHYYQNMRVEPTKFTADNAAAQLTKFADMEKAIVQQRALLDSYDPERRVGLLIDEWGVWDGMIPAEEKKYGRLWQQNTLRSAVGAALGLNVFHRHAGKLVMGNIAQTVNVLHAMLLAYEDKCIRTPSYYAFELAKPHRAKTAVRAETGDSSPLGLSVSASRQDNELVLTLINPRHDTPLKAACRLSSGRAASATARILHHENFNAANTFEQPDLVVPRPHAAAAEGSRVTIDLPPMSIVTASVRI